MSVKQIITTPYIAEATTALLALQLTDETDAPLTLGEIAAVTLTLYEKRSRAILNGRDEQDIKNTNGGIVDGDGSLGVTLSLDDNRLTSQSHLSEYHVALIEWTWEGGDKAGSKEVTFRVVNLAKVS